MTILKPEPSTSTPPPLRILIINPNTSHHMTDALRPVVDSLALPSAQYTFFTSPSPGIPSINSPADAAESARICLPHLTPLLEHHDCFLVACYSQHPLVSQLKSECAKLRRKGDHTTHDGAGGARPRKYVTGIFEASVLASLSLIDPSGDADADAGAAPAFGIVSTGKIWETALQKAVEEFIGVDPTTAKPSRSRFVGCETTGLNASELHDLDPAEVRARMMEATKRLLRRGKSGGDGAGDISRVQAICLGCAGMVGLDDAVRTACVEELGPERGNEVSIVDGVKAGVGLLYGLAKGGF
jgi:Asp/Glu/hydantoin racemase